jgi:putative phosphoesterase
VRYGILSDIHGNIWALDAVLQHASHRRIERFLNLGDILYGPLEPRKTFERLQTLDAVTIQGNQDREIYEALPDSPTLRYVLDQLNTTAVEWLRSLPKTAIAGSIFACHGSPSSDVAYLLEDVRLGFPLVRDDAAIAADLFGIEQPIVVCGHTHHARAVRISSGHTVVNPGSIGLPAYDHDVPSYHAMQAYAPHASYAIIDDEDKERHVEFFRVEYPFEKAVDAAERRGRHDWAEWLATGRVRSSS